ncbi:hypothetical protein HY285_02065 [Candidatus Peregrinibacteria bacterium]|nr:hypothetical protein [Candidatus Peregrinibacteria bacterium]
MSKPVVAEDSVQGIRVLHGRVDIPLDYSASKLTPDCRAYRPYASSYILCSEKGNVQVAVCISQVTDNPKLAEDIFSTFHWTK